VIVVARILLENGYSNDVGRQLALSGEAK